MKKYPIQPEILEAITACVANPETVTPQNRMQGESVRQHVIRALVSMFQPIEASDGSAQPVEPSVLVSLVAIAKETHPRINPNSSPAECRERDELIRQAESARGIGEVRDLFNAAKGVSPDQLELQLARGHLREASRAFEALRAENNQLRNYLRVAGDLLGRADADPIKLAAKVEAGIIAKGEEISGLEAEADKARRVIAGNTNIEDNGSLLDMLNAILSRGDVLKQYNELRDTVERLREKEALHTESNGMLAQERDRAQAALAGLVKIIDKAGLDNLSNGVQLGRLSWYVKASDVMEFARTQLPKCSQCKKPCVPCSENGNSTTLCADCFPF